MELLYGTQPGVYPYNTKSTNCFDSNCTFSAGKTALSISGLKPGTTYYVLPTARPDPNDDTNICNSAACGAVEQMVTTVAGPEPAPVVPPQQWVPTPPDTSSYTVVSMQVGPTGECVAASKVTSSDGWSVNAGDPVQTVLNEVGYGTVLEFPQGAMCQVPPIGPAVATTGYILPSKPPDPSGCGGPCQLSDPMHRWIVLRTQQILPADFPPFGSRITPAWAPKLAKLYSSKINHFSQLFDAEAGTAGVHHFWFQNMEWEDDPHYVNPADYVDPPGFPSFARLGSQYQTSNNQYLVLDRIYAHGPGAPIRHLQGYELGGNYVAMIGCYTSQIETWRLTAWPSNSGTLSPDNTILNIPQNNFRFQSATATLGMNAPAVATLSGTGSGNMVGNLYKDRLEIQFTSGAGTISCQNCSAVATSAPSTPPTAIQLFSGTIANGQFSQVNWNTAEWQTSQYVMAFGIMFSDLRAPGGPYYLANNYLDGVGEGFYIDPQYSNYSNDDITYIRNHEIWPKNYFVSDPNWIGWRYDVRQHWEIKRGHRISLIGNVFSYSWAYQNDGPAIILSGRPTYIAQTLNDGISDVDIESNIVRHGRTGITCGGTSPMDNGGNQMDGEITRRVTITNNLMFDLGRWKYCDTVNCPSLGSFYFENRPGCQDLVIRNNTAGLDYGDMPVWLYVGGGTNLSNYIAFENNVLFFSDGPVAGGSVWGDWPPNVVSNHDIHPAVTYNNGGSSPPFVGTLNSSFIHTAATVTPNYVWQNNVAIGGWTGQQNAQVDLTQAQLSQYAANSPPDVFPPGNSTAARANAAGLPNALTNNLQSVPPASVGVDFDKLTVDQGLTTGIAPPKAETSGAQFSYTAPDSRACAVDVSGDGANWVRTMDAGGDRSRSVSVSGLSPGMQYHYRILCYYEQVNDGVLYTDYTSDQITNGTFSTARKLAGPR